MPERELAVAVLRRALQDLADALDAETWPACEAYRFLQGNGEWGASRVFWAHVAEVDADALHDRLCAKLARARDGGRQQVQAELRGTPLVDAGQAVGRPLGHGVMP